MTIEEIVHLLHWHKPERLKDIKALGIKLYEISRGEGAFRRVFKVSGAPIVIKIPRNKGDDLAHARAEAKTARRIRRYNKYKILRPYLPEIFYFDHDTGIMAMRFYSKVPWNRMNQAGSNAIEDLIDIVWNDTWEGYTDVGPRNIGLQDIGGREQFVVIDLGCFMENNDFTTKKR